MNLWSVYMATGYDVLIYDLSMDTAAKAIVTWLYW